MQFSSEQRLDGGVLERGFILGVKGATSG